MRLLDRYLLRELLAPLVFCTSGFLILWMASNLSWDLARLQSNKLTSMEIVEYYICRMPELLNTVAPFSLLLALLYTLTNLARHHELVAIRAAGISLWRLSIPYLAVGILFSLGLLLLNEVFAPNSAAAAEEILSRHAEHQVNDALNFSNDAENRIWNIGSYSRETGEMKNLRVEWNPADHTRRTLFADSGGLTNGVWTFALVKVYVYDPPAYDIPRPMSTNVLALPEFNETLELIRSEIKISKMSRAMAAKRIRFTLAEIFAYQRLHPRLAPDMQAMLRTQLHGRLAQPWTSLVVVLIAIPFGAQSGRRNVVAGVSVCIFICFAYYFLSTLGLNLGTGEHLPPWFAAWLPNCLFGGGGVLCTFLVR